MTFDKPTIEAIKLRSPIEEIVRDRVPGLRRAGALWQACCPFHQEKTPSFKVDPRRGTWHCYGACGIGGDVIDFVERSLNVDFAEAVEYLAGHCGIALPERGSGPSKEELEPKYAVLARAADFYRRQLRGAEGRAALDYVRGRGLTDATIDAFGLGYAPAAGELVSRARAAGVPIEALKEVGLARVDDSGRPYDFFRGRLMFPVRDLKGRTVGFGARRLGDGDPHSPKYVNTPETPLFHKGRLIYGLDLALEHVRRGSHLILVEGYTDVMAAHQVGLRQVVAVLGTATTDEHAALVRRSGARRISLLFDGDEAGRKATVRALDGLLPLETEIDVVRLPGDEDPCDLLVREGAGALERHLERATGWFEFLVEWIVGLRGELSAAAISGGSEYFKAIDVVLGLFTRIQKPVVRDERIAALARALDVPVEGMREQFESLPQRQREKNTALREHDRRRADERSTDDRREGAAALPSRAAADPRLELALRDIAAAALCDPSLAVHCAAYAEHAEEPDLRRLLATLGALHARTVGTFAVGDVLDELLGDPARELVVPLLGHAERAERAIDLYSGAAERVESLIEERRVRLQVERLRAGGELEQEQLRELHDRLRSRLARGPHV